MEPITSPPEVRAKSVPAERAWKGGFTDVTKEHGFVPLRVEGRIPEEIEGTLYRNGPGLFSCFGTEYAHWFDSDGLISSVRFSGGRAEGAVRLLETPGLLEERRRGKAYFGLYGTVAPGPWNPFRAYRSVKGDSKNPANTSVLAWAGHTYALCEIGKPFEFDPKDLTSIGPNDLGGTIPRTFSAHPHRVASNGYVYNLGVRVGRPAHIDLFALRPDGSSGRVASVPLPFTTMIHDFAVTERFLVILVAPLRLNLLRTLFARGAFSDNLEWEGTRGTEVIVVPLDAPMSPVRFFTDAFWSWHVANAFESGGELVLDITHYRDFPSNHAWLSALTHGGPSSESDGYLTRARIDPKRERLTFEKPFRERTGEFPRVAPSIDAKPHRSVYWTEHSSKRVSVDGPPDSIVRVDVETGSADVFVCPRGQYPSEGVFIPRANAKSETDGWIAALIYDAAPHASHWALFDAAHLADGPIARAHLDHHVPLTFHGTWLPGRVATP